MLLPTFLVSVEVRVTERTVRQRLLSRRTELILNVLVELLLLDGLRAARALGEVLLGLAFIQEVFGQRGDLYDLLAVGAPAEHRTLLPVVQVQALFREVFALLATEDARVLQLQ